MTDPVHYTQAQMRETVGLSLETYRHWRRVLPPLATKGGRAACFSIGDLVAASILNRLTETAGVRVGHLSDVSTAIFEICNTSPWAALVSTMLLVDLEQRTCSVERALKSHQDANLVLSCRLDPILAQLRDALLRGQSGRPQTELLLPPGSHDRCPPSRSAHDCGKPAKHCPPRWKDRLGLTYRRLPELYESAESAVGVPHAPAIRTALEDMGLSAVFCVQGVPTVAASWSQMSTIARPWSIFKRSSGTRDWPACCWVIAGDTIRAFSLARTPLDEPGDAFETRCLIEALDLTDEVLRIRGLIDGAESGRLWRDHASYFPLNERIDQVLLENLKFSHQLLQADGLSSDAAQALLIQAMFVAYLEDREIATPAYFEVVSGETYSQLHWAARTGDVDLLRALFPGRFARLQRRSVRRSVLV